MLSAHFLDMTQMNLGTSLDIIRIKSSSWVGRPQSLRRRCIRIVMETRWYFEIVCEDVHEENQHGIQPKLAHNVPQIHIIKVGWLSTVSQLTLIYSNSLLFLLLIDSGEQEFYEKVIQVEDLKEWEVSWMMRCNPSC